MKATHSFLAFLALSAAGLALAAFTLDSFRTLQTSVTATTTNLCTNVTINVETLDTIGLQFRGSLAGAGNGNIVIVFTRGLDSNTLDNAACSTWTIDASAWAKSVTNYASTNLFSVRDFRTLAVYSIGNANTSTLSAVQLQYGSK